MTRRWVYDFTEASADSPERLRALLGGKGAGLNEMTRAGLAVPPGFTITTECCARYFELGRVWPDALEEQVREHLRRLAESAGLGDRPTLVAVRSGAAVSMPGMMDTILNCPVEPFSQLRRSITAVFDSWLSDRAVAYRRRNDIRGLDGTAVTVQIMFPSEVSGVVFTEDPNDPAAGRMVIEASPGLGESVVSGDVTPDKFLVRRDDQSFEVEAAATGAVSLSPAQVRELAELALRVEKHFGHPVDVEFGWHDGRFAVLQSRRIRGLDVARDVAVARAEEIERLRSLADGRQCCWVIHNLGETLPFPTPLTWDVIRGFMSGRGGYGQMYRQLGYRPSKRVCRDGFLELICGRIYTDPNRQAELFWDAMPMRYDAGALAADVSLLDRAPTKFDPSKADGRFLLHLPANVLALFRARRNRKRLRKTAREAFEDQAVGPFLAYVEGKRAQDLTAMSDAQLLAELDARRAAVLDDFGPASLLPGFFGGMAFDALGERLSQLMGPARGAELAATLVGGLDGDATFQQDALLHRVAAGQATIKQFLAEYGHRCVGEMELAQPRWREDASYLEHVTANLRSRPGRSPEQIHADGQRKRLAAQESLPDVLAEWGGSCFREDVRRDLADAQALLPYRETGKHYLMMGYELIRLATEELGRRWEIGPDVYFLRLEEMDTFTENRSHLADQIAARRVRREALRRLTVGDVIDSRDLESLGGAPPPAAADTLTGRAVAAGSAEGIARVVFRPDGAAELADGDILVCPSTDPGWTPLFLRAGGLVVERGGVLSHGAIVAREFGIPAVVCPEATRRIRSGDRIRVDGSTGQISIIQSEGRP